MKGPHFLASVAVEGATAFVQSTVPNASVYQRTLKRLKNHQHPDWPTLDHGDEGGFLSIAPGLSGSS